jgi:hypothetical protein
LPFRIRRESPNSCLGHFVLRRRGEPVSARTGLNQQGRRKLLDPTTTAAAAAAARLFAGVDVSKDRLDVCLRWSEPESHEREEAFFVSYDESGIDALISRLLQEPSAC